MEGRDTPLPGRFALCDPSAWRGGFGYQLYIKDQDNEPWVEFKRTYPGQTTRHAVLNRCAHLCLEVLQDAVQEGNHHAA